MAEEEGDIGALEEMPSAAGGCPLLKRSSVDTFLKPPFMKIELALVTRLQVLYKSTLSYIESTLELCLWAELLV